MAVIFVIINIMGRFMKTYRLALTVMVLFGTVSCDNYTYFTFKECESVNEFPMTGTIENPEIIKIDAIGVNGLKCVRDYLLVSTFNPDGTLAAFTKDGKPVSEPFLKVGRGPGEVLFPPYMSWIDFHDDGKTIFAGMYNQKGAYIDYDILKSIENGVASWTCVMDSLSMESGARCMRCGQERFICRKSQPQMTGYERFFLDKSGDKTANTSMEYLNSISSTDNNILSTLILSSPDGKNIAELGSRTNIAHIYSVSDDFQKTLVIGDGLKPIKELEKQEEEDMLKHFYDAKAYDTFFVALYLGCKISELDNGTFPPPSLLFFDWKGKPSAEIKLPVQTLCFEIDVTEQDLYIVDYETEHIFRYDIDSICQQLL